MDKISVIVPCFNEEETLPIFYKEINKVIKKMSNVYFELIFVDDGSSDETINIIKNLVLAQKLWDDYLVLDISNSFKKKYSSSG